MIDTSLPAAGRDVHLTEGALGVGNDTEKSAEVIVVTGNTPCKTREVLSHRNRYADKVAKD